MRDYELITMDIIIRPVYQIFKEYSLNPNMDACPCCVNEEDKKQVFSKSLQQLTEEDLNKYSWKALSTWGEVKDFKHFLPRILELEIYKNVGFHCLSGKLEYGNFNTWPEHERKVIEDFFVEYFQLLFVKDERYDAEDFAKEIRKIIPDFLSNSKMKVFLESKFYSLIYAENPEIEISDFVELIFNISDRNFVEDFILIWPEDLKGMLSFSSFINEIYHYNFFSEKSRAKLRKFRLSLEAYWYEHSEVEDKLSMDRIISAVGVIELIFPVL